MNKKQIRKFINKKSRGQAMVEFALALPVVLLIVFGIIEVGFLLFSYSSVNSAAREAARYGIAIEDVGSAQRYYDCDGIVDAGLRIGRFAGMTSGEISIAYDQGPETTNIANSCAELVSGDPGQITFGDRIVVSVNHQYQPLIAYMGLNINPFTMTSTSARTIFKNAEIIPGGGDGAGGGGGGGGGGECYVLTLSAAGGLAEPPTASLAEDCTNGDGEAGYTSGTAVALQAHPQTDWHVGLWSGADVDPVDSNYAYITMNADATVQVTYSPDSDTCYALSTTYTGEGNNPLVSPSGVCASGYAEGEVITFTGQPAAGYGTLSWTGASKVDKTTATLIMPATDGIEIVANYVPCYGVDLYSESPATWGGAPQVVTESDTCSGETFREGENLLLQAYPNPGYDTDVWNGATQNPTNEDHATLVMPAGIPSASVVYVEEPILDPPSSLNVPNDFIAGDFGYDYDLDMCTSIEFYFAPSTSPVGNWPDLPDYYNVTVRIDSAGGPVTSVYNVTSPQWTAGASVGSGYNISFGVEAVFLSDPSDISRYSEVTYRCIYEQLEPNGSLIK